MATGARRDFAALLDELLRDEAEAAEVVGPPRSLDYLSVADELHSGRINFTDKRAEAEYRAHQAAPRPEPPRTQKQAKPTVKPPSTDPDEIAAELGLTGDAGTAEPKKLDRLRRDFAFRNHPDRVPAHLRAHAMIRMQVANMLIDEAKRRPLTKPGRGKATA
ncbi:hypothetical protein [Nitratireductor pacificus]|uniref:J domain-containing protein n=1 Tax=Nitratireductor pacificus pht-3B TaxID=391937 RepID=K2MG47_9HYPH|nr:hypothetical protein [Nitratireductor pacificus]EKF19670.1 hypothetical protein NA2_07247 [Nitratireductor pacificus pht-3B]